MLARWRAVVMAAGLAGLVVSLDTTVNIAFPAIGATFRLGVADIQWVVVSYVLTYAALLLAAGRLGDVFGHRRLVLAGLSTTAAGVALCGVVPTFGWFLAARVVQGVGAALVLGAAPALVTLAAPDADRSRALGGFQTGAALGVAVGPALGGVLVEAAGWRWVYLFRAPLALAAAAVLARTVRAPAMPAAAQAATGLPVGAGPGGAAGPGGGAGPGGAAGPGGGAGPGGAAGRSAPGLAVRLDVAGALTLAAGVVGGLLAVSRVRVAGWASPLVVGGLVAAAIGLVAWVRVERRAALPTMDPTLFHHGPFALANALSLVANGTMFAIWLLAPYYLVEVRGLSPVVGGLALGAQPLATALASPLAGRLDGRVPTGRLCTAGLAIEAGGLALVALVADGAPVVAVAAAFFVTGAGIGLFGVPNTSYVMGSIERSRQGVAAGLTQMTRTVGVVSGVAFASLFFDARRSGHAARSGLAAGDPAPFVAAFRDTFALVAGLCAAAALASTVRAPRAAPAGAPAG